MEDNRVKMELNKVYVRFKPICVRKKLESVAITPKKFRFCLPLRTSSLIQSRLSHTSLRSLLNKI